MKRLLILAFILLTGCASTSMNYQPDIAPSSAKQSVLDLNEGLDDLSRQIVASLMAENKRKIAIMPFSDLHGKASDFGKFLSDELIDQLFTTQKFGIIERLLIDKILKEHELSISGLLDPKSVKQLGHILGVDAIATGTYTIMNHSVRIRTRIIDVETAEVFAVAKNEIEIDNNIINLLQINNRSKSRWMYESEENKQAAFDRHIERALNYMEESSRDLANVYRCYKAALVEIEMALTIYPENQRCIQMKNHIQQILFN